MKRIHRILLNLFPIYALLTIGCFSSCRTAHIPEKQEAAISGNVLIVFYDAETGKSDLLSATKNMVQGSSIHIKILTASP